MEKPQGWTASLALRREIHAAVGAGFARLRALHRGVRGREGKAIPYDGEEVETFRWNVSVAKNRQPGAATRWETPRRRVSTGESSCGEGGPGSAGRSVGDRT